MTPQLLLVNPYRTLQGRCVILVHGGLTSGLAAWLSGNSHSTRPRPPLKKAKETLRHHRYRQIAQARSGSHVALRLSLCKSRLQQRHTPAIPGEEGDSVTIEKSGYR